MTIHSRGYISVNIAPWSCNFEAPHSQPHPSHILHPFLSTPLQWLTAPLYLSSPLHSNIFGMMRTNSSSTCTTLSRTLSLSTTPVRSNSFFFLITICAMRLMSTPLLWVTWNLHVLSIWNLTFWGDCPLQWMERSGTYEPFHSHTETLISVPLWLMAASLILI